MNWNRLNGLIAATYTPMHVDGRVNLDVVGEMVDYLIEQRVSALYVCGSTGEGMSLTADERRSVAQAYVDASAKRVPVVVQVGHNSLQEARGLAEHAQQIGANVISATCPSYFSVCNETTLANCMAEVAGGAPELPFYYYHIPALTGSTIDIAKFMQIGARQIENLAGLKYTDTKLFEFQSCLAVCEGKFDIVWGCDEMLLGALATGARAAIGSTYNVAAPLYQRLITAFESGAVEEARKLQFLSVKMVQVMARYPFHSAMKHVLSLRGVPSGECRLPQESLTEQQKLSLRDELAAIGFFDWSQSAIHART